VKLGQEGAVAAQSDLLVRAQASVVERRSLFGAGDAFAAALLVSLARHGSLEEALELGCEAGAQAGASPDGWPPDPLLRP
jgi:sugar/nucleoside kinase (ribokinase family)